MPPYKIPPIICFRCPLYGKEKQCLAAQKRASTIRTHGVCPKIEYDVAHRRQTFGDPQVQANKIIAEARKQHAAIKRGAVQ